MKTILTLLLTGLCVQAGVSSKTFGTMPDGKEVKVFTLKNANGMVAKITEYGATLTELHVPDAKGKTANVTLGFDNLKQYLGRHPAFGATIERLNGLVLAEFPSSTSSARLALGRQSRPCGSR